MEENNTGISGMEQLEQVNTRYLRMQVQLENRKREIKDLREQYEELRKEVIVINGEIAEQELLGIPKDSKTIKMLKETRDERIQRGKAIRKEAVIIEEEVKEIKEKIDSVMEQLKQTPELKEHIENCLSVRYDRQNKKILKEMSEKEAKKQQETKKIAKMQKIKEIITKHPTIKNNIVGFLQAKRNIADLNEKLSKVDPTNVAEINKLKKEIEQNNKKYDKNRDLLKTYFTKHKEGITEKDILSLEAYLVTEKGNINLDATIANSIKESQNNISRIDKNLRRLNKRALVNEQSIYNLGRTPSNRAAQSVQTQNNHTEAEQAESADGSQENNDEEKEVKWWQFWKRIKQNRERKQRARLPETAKAEAEETVSGKRNDFSTSLKYDVVRQMMEDMSKETIKTSKQIVKENLENEAQQENEEETQL